VLLLQELPMFKQYSRQESISLSRFIGLVILISNKFIILLVRYNRKYFAW